MGDRCGSGFSRDSTTSRLTPFLLIAVPSTLLLAGVASAQPAASLAASPHRIECTAPAAEGDAVCRTDLAVFLGKRTFDEYCASCHARDALGSSFAPNLAERARGLTHDQFMDLLERGYGGEARAMTRWAAVPAVRNYAEPLWVYLSARAAGDLPPGPIELLPDAGEP